MDLIESGNMSADDEFGHWWISTRFEYVERVLALASERQQAVSVVEFGCGTAQNLRFCRQRSRFKGKVDRLSGVDPGVRIALGKGQLQNSVDVAGAHGRPRRTG